ncbi:unnamed protein product [Caenorhabditis auriculariae]|uniref:ZP domain-containing protein n=1 Tax=Caenorhabditis auriculariae TaxID=2777116 RepID=A0A8S1GPM8_9PELO|nr:unnamed protein product [Caenorhabditis auriculariae]
MNHIKAWAFPTSNEVNIFCNLHVCATCEQTNCRDRQRRTPGLPGDPPGMRDPFSAPIDTSDISPPIPIRTSFRLKRESNVATMRPQNVGTSSEGANSSSFVGSYTMILVFFVVTTILFYL